MTPGSCTGWNGAILGTEYVHAETKNAVLQSRGGIERERDFDLGHCDRTSAVVRRNLCEYGVQHVGRHVRAAETAAEPVGHIPSAADKPRRAED